LVGAVGGLHLVAGIPQRGRVEALRIRDRATGRPSRRSPFGAIALVLRDSVRRTVQLGRQRAKRREGGLYATIGAGLEHEVDALDVLDLGHVPGVAVGLDALPAAPEDGGQADVGRGPAGGGVGEDLVKELADDAAGVGGVKGDGPGNAVFEGIPGAICDDAGEVAQGGVVVEPGWMIDEGGPAVEKVGVQGSLEGARGDLQVGGAVPAVMRRAR